MTKVNLREKLALFQDHWNPRIVGELNGQHVKLVKFLGEFVWHKHDPRTSYSWSSRGGSAWTSGTGRSGWRRASS